MKRNLLIFGAGQFGIVAKEIAIKMECFDKIDFVDDNSNLAIASFAELKKIKKDYDCFIVAIGKPKLRADFVAKGIKNNLQLVSLIDPNASISSTAIVSNGCIIESGAVISPNVSIGLGCIIMANAVVGHNAAVKEYCQLKYNCTVSENSIVPTMTKIECNYFFNVL